MTALHRQLRAAAIAVLALVSVVTSIGIAGAQFVNFESGHVRPLALSPAGDLLCAVNTPDDRLVVYRVTAGGLTRAAEVPVGLEPVAVATRTNTTTGRVEAWVVNHLSDSVSVVEIDPADPSLAHVVRTLLVGDEPRDIVFAGSAGNRVFITAAHRGQNRPGGPQLTTPGIGRADVWAFDADDLGANLGGTPLSIVQLFGDTPRALAVSPNGATVYAAVFQSGNRTTTIPQPVVSAHGGLPPPPAGSTPNAPETGLIVKFNPANNRWEDELARNWTASVPFSLPDRDVFLIDADHNPPALATGTNSVVGVGTILFNMVVRPTNGKLYVSNTDARNQVRFEPVLQGHITESRITVVNGTTPTAVPLNPHIDYGVVPGPPAEVVQTLAFPTDMVFSADGLTLFVAALGSDKIAALDAGSLEAGQVVGDQLAVGSGPSGLALDEAHNRLYVMNRIDQTISIVSNASNPATRAVTATVSVGYDPEPPVIRNGRHFLYDARTSSAHGDAACASCHVFGDFDSLAWDLGDPFGQVVNNPNPFRVVLGSPVFHPLKGPMTTQSLRGMADAGPMHWRGDRSAGVSGGDPLDEDGAFKLFNPAFVSLLGRSQELSASEMQAFTDFILTVRYPPNPIRALDDSFNSPQLTADGSAGQTFFTNTPVDANQPCDFCHRLPFGTDGFSSFEGETQEFKIAHLRNAYQKIGMFGVASGVTGIPATGFLGDQVRGFGFLHDGSIPTPFDFLQADVFVFNNNTQRRNLEAFVQAFDTGLKPAVGQQVSLTKAAVDGNDTTVFGRIDLLIARDEAGDCDLVVKGIVAGEPRGAVYVGGDEFQTDRDSEAPVGKLALRSLAATVGQEQVYTCVPPGSGVRIGVDRDEDGFGDRTELDAGSDPADPASVPGGATPTATPGGNGTPTRTPTRTATRTPTPTRTPTATGPTATPRVVLIGTTSLKLRDGSAPPSNPHRRKLSFKSVTKNDPFTNQIGVPSSGSAGDPTLGGATLVVYNANGSGEAFTIALPASGWTARNGPSYRFKGADSSAPITKVEVKANQIKIRGGRESFGYTLDEPSQGRIAIRLTLGTSPTWCADAPAKASGNPPSTAKYDRVDKFIAAPKSPRPAACPAVPGP